MRQLLNSGALKRRPRLESRQLVNAMRKSVRRGRQRRKRSRNGRKRRTE